MNIQFFKLEKVPLAILVISIIYFAYAASYEIKYPGLYYDETLFVNGALGGLDNTFIHKRIFGIPVMLMPYIGAVKAYLFYPIFYFLGVSPETIRIPVIIISTLTLILSFYLAEVIFNKWFASLVAIILATDPSFIYTTRLDWGPVVLMIFFKVLALFLLFKIISESNNSHNQNLIYWYIVFLSVLILGLWDKLNFIWFISALFICCILLYLRKIIKIWNAYKSKMLVPTMTFLLIISLMIVGLIIPVLSFGEKTSESLSSRFSRLTQIYEATVTGRAVYEWIFDQPLPEVTWVNQLTFLTVIILLITLCISILFKSNYNYIVNLEFDSKRMLVFFTLLFGFIYMQMISTRQAGGPHHIMMLFPFQHFFNISAVIVLLQLIIQKFGNFAQKISSFMKIFYITSIMIVFGYLIHTQIQVNNHYSLAFQNKLSFNNRWSPKIYELSEYLIKNKGQIDYIYSADWGFHTQLHGLAEAKYRSKYIDLWASFNDLHKLSKDKQEKFYESFFKGKNIFVVLHSENFAIMEYSRSNFIEFSSKFLKSSKLIQEFSTNKNGVIYEIYNVEG